MKLPVPSLTPRQALLLGATGGSVGPLIDGIHNQVLLEYDLLPLTLGPLKTSLIVPPLLALTYVVLGSFASRPGSPSRALTAVASTAAIVKLSVFVNLQLLAVLALVQWLLVDASVDALLVASVVAIAGPLCEIPFVQLGCWHYVAPDYFPFGTGLASITAPCYFAVCTDALALGRCFKGDDLERTPARPRRTASDSEVWN